MTILTKSLLITALSAINLSACALSGHEVDLINTTQAKDSQQFQDNLEAAQEGNIEAQYNLGVDYLNGLRTEENDLQALKWFAPAAQAGHSGAQYYLGEFYLYGLATLEVDQKEALQWYQKAAAQGHQLAQIMVKQLTESKSNPSSLNPSL
jgi:TPR repeat protein